MLSITRLRESFFKASTWEIIMFKRQKHFPAKINVLCTFYFVFDHLIE